MSPLETLTLGQLHARTLHALRDLRSAGGRIAEVSRFGAPMKAQLDAMIAHEEASDYADDILAEWDRRLPLMRESVDSEGRTPVSPTSEWIVHVGWFDARGFLFRKLLRVPAPTEMEARREAYRKHRDPRAPFTAYQTAVVIPAQEAHGQA